MIRGLIFTIALMLATLSYADSKKDKHKHKHKDGASKKSEMGYWKKEDCKKTSDAAGGLLYFSGELLKDSDKKRKSGNEEGADEDFKGAYALSEIAANYAKAFEAFCKK